MSGLGDGAGASIVSLNLRDRRLQWQGGVKRIPLPHGLPLYPLLRSHSAEPGINHLFASASERWLAPLLARRRGILTVAKGSAGLDRIERNAATLQRFKAVVVQSAWDRDLMRQVGVPDGSLKLIRPGIPLGAYREGVMNLAWVGFLTLFILAEKIGTTGARLSRAGGAILIALGAVLVSGSA